MGPQIQANQKKTQHQTQTTTETKTSNNNKMNLRIYRHFDGFTLWSTCFHYLSVSFRIFYLFPSLLLFVFLFFSPSCCLVFLFYFLSQNGLSVAKACKDNNTNKNTIKQGLCCLFWSFFLCSLPKQQTQNNKTTNCSFSLKQNKG